MYLKKVSKTDLSGSKILGFIAGIFLLIALLFNLKALRYNCFNGYDLAIYQQAAFEIGAGNSLNPYLTVRNLNIFNDHFDPVVIIAGLWSRLLNFSSYSIILLEFVTTCLGIFLLFWKGGAEKRRPLLIFFLAIFSKGILNALYFPGHASFWSLPLFVFIVWLYLKENWGPLVFSAALLCLFKENFALAVLGLGMSLVWVKVAAIKKNKKNGQLVVALLLFVIGTFSLYFSFSLRAKLLGPVFEYGDHYLQYMLNAPWAFIQEVLLKTSWNENFKILAPLGLALFITRKYADEESKEKIWGVMGLALPLFGLQFITRGLGYQYSFPLYAIILSYLAFAIRDWSRVPALGQWSLVLSFFLTSMGSHTKAINFLINNTGQKCIVNSDKHLDTQRIQAVLLAEKNPEANIAVTGGVVNQLLAPNRKIFHIESHSKKMENYQYIVLELNDSGDTYPLNKDEVAQIKNLCKAYAQDVIVDNDHYYFARGSFPRECVNPFNKI